MNFFSAQDKARRNTYRLVFLFALAIVCLVTLTNILIIGTFAYMEAEGQEGLSTFVLSDVYDPDIMLMISAGVVLLILLGSLYKIAALSKGGAAIAEMLGGQLVPQGVTEHDEKKLLNVVEEMSIAAGMPIPKVYLLNDESINAFAAGLSHKNAVIGVTRGALKYLTRSELQGVIAHEFSHILNGDMRINLRLIGVLHGILLIGIIGESILRSTRYSRGSKKDNGGAIILIGIGLFVIGYAGVFFGKWIKSSVSRQREFLADASAVQFTRDKDTIAGALKKIGGLSSGSLLSSPLASEYSHAYFSSGINNFFASMFATHPPLKDRIKSIDRSWNGRFVSPNAVDEADSTSEKKSPLSTNPITGMDVVTAAVIVASAEKAVNKIGTIQQENIEYAQQLIANIPESLKAASQNAYSARALVYVLLIKEQKDKDAVKAIIKQYADKGVAEITETLYLECVEIDERLILPLLELCVSALRELSSAQYGIFRNTIEKIVRVDKKIDMYEWVIQRLVLQQLDEHFLLRKPAKEKHAYIGAVKNEAEIVFSLIANIEHKNAERAEQAFVEGISEIGAKAFKFVSKDKLSLELLNDSLDALMQLKPILKEKVLKAIVVIILSDGKTTRRGVELFRAIASNLNCPVPPLEV